MKFTYLLAVAVAISAVSATIIPPVKGLDYDGYDTYDTYDTSGISDGYDTSGVSDISDTYVDTSTTYDIYLGQVYTQPIDTGILVTTLMVITCSPLVWSLHLYPQLIFFPNLLLFSVEY